MFVIFNEKSKLLNLLYRQKHTFSQHYWRSNKLVIFFYIKLASRHIFYRISIRSNLIFCRNQNFVCLFKLTYFIVAFFFASKISISHLENCFLIIFIVFLIFVVVANKHSISKINFMNIFVIAKRISIIKSLLKSRCRLKKTLKFFFDIVSIIKLVFYRSNNIWHSNLYWQIYYDCENAIFFFVNICYEFVKCQIIEFISHFAIYFRICI